MYIILMLLGIFLLLFTTGDISYYLDVASLLVIIVIPLLGLIASGMLQDFARTGKLMFMKNHFYNREELESTRLSLVLFKRLSLASGLIGSLTGFVGAIRFCDMSKEMLLGFSVAVLTTLYAMIVWIILTSLEYKVKRDIISIDQEEE